VSGEIGGLRYRRVAEDQQAGERGAKGAVFSYLWNRKHPIS
jgi:hypothetical protein